MNVSPFQNTKATYFNDEEIVKYWVNDNYEDIKKDIMLPDSSIPIFILGGKGVGKTHILRYFSFQTQKIRAEAVNKNHLDYIIQEKYLGIYLVSSSLSTHRFSGRGIDEESWKNIFYYYINLELIEKFAKKIIEIFNESSYLNLQMTFDCLYPEFNKQYSIVEFYNFIRKKKVEIDQKVSKLGMPGVNTSIINDIHPIFNVEDSSFEIIHNILSSFEKLKNVDVLIIIDEYENLNIYQQKYFNTLLRHPNKEKRIKIRIAGRLYALKTKETLDDGEKLLNDSEVRFVSLDSLYEKDFKKFSTNLYQTRLVKDYLNYENIDFNSTFEDSNSYINKILKKIEKKIEDDKEKKSFLKFRNDLKGKYNENEIKKILFNITDEDVLIEKVNIFLCYKNFKKNLVEFTSNINENKKAGDYKLQKTQLLKFKDDMICQLFREYREDYCYGGYENIVKMSNNNPRIFLSILNNIHLACKSSKIDLYKDFIPIRDQHLAIIKTSEWFWNNFTEDVKDQRILWAVDSLCEYFRESRLSSKPSEKTLISFSYDEKEVAEELNNLITLAVKHNLLIEKNIHKRKDKNSRKLKRQLRIHPMLSPRWELPLSVGGTISFSKNEITALFGRDEVQWNIFKNNRLKQLNPSLTNPGKVSTMSLFAEE